MLSPSDLPKACLSETFSLGIQRARRGFLRCRSVGSSRGAAILFFALGLAEVGCGRVPEQALRDEQARSRRYRDAYETLQEEVTALRARAAEQKGCAAQSLKLPKTGSAGAALQQTVVAAGTRSVAP